LILTTFKWNVHTQSRTANQLWLTEIVEDNPCRIHPRTAENHGLEEGREFKIIRHDHHGNPLSIVVKPFITETIHPHVLANSASFGHWQYGRTAKGMGYNSNQMISNGMDPVGGGQAWNDTVVTIGT